MSRYRKIDVGIHNDAKFRSLSDKAKLLWFTILTCPELTSLGCMKFTEAGFAEEMGWTLQAFREAFREVLGHGMIKHCSEAKFLCIPNFLKYNQPESINVVKSWANLEPLLPECELRTKHIQELKGILLGISQAFHDALPHDFEIHDLIPNSSPNPNTIKDRYSPLPEKLLKRPKKPAPTYLPDNFAISERVRTWARDKGFNHLGEQFEWFVDWAKAHAKQYADWDAAFMNCIRGNWGKIDLTAPEKKQARKVCPRCGAWEDLCVCQKEKRHETHHPSR